MNRIDVIQNNLRDLVSKRDLSLTEAAQLAGVSKQYLSQYLNDSAGSKKDQLQDELCLILEISPARLNYEDPFPTPPVVIPSNPSTERPMVIPIAELPGRLTELYRQENYHQLSLEYQAVSPDSLNQLPVREQAEIQLLAGKAMVHSHEYEKGNALLTESLKLFQQRQTLQPGVFIPRIMDCYRYLALAAFLQGDKHKSLTFHQRLIAKVSDLDTNLLTQELMIKLRPAFTNAVTLAKQTGQAALAADLRKAALNIYTYSDVQGREWLEQELALSQAKVAHLFSDLSSLAVSGTDSKTDSKIRTLLNLAHQGIGWLEQGLGFSAESSSASTSSDSVNSFTQQSRWRIQSYLALGRQDYILAARIAESPPSDQPRTNLFSHYLMTQTSIFTQTSDQAWRAVYALQRCYYSGNVLGTDYYLVAHCLAELALTLGHRQTALNHMLDALWCVRSAGEQEERLRLLDRLKQMNLVETSNGTSILEQKINNACDWLKTYWEEK